MLLYDRPLCRIELLMKGFVRGGAHGQQLSVGVRQARSGPGSIQQIRKVLEGGAGNQNLLCCLPTGVLARHVARVRQADV